MSANLYALGAIILWASLASLSVSLRHVPPFLLTGVALLIGSIPSWPLIRQWRVPLSTLAIGIFGLFGYHFLFFVALRLAPPVQANLVNYLWPLLIVVLAPLYLRGVTLKALHIVAAVMGFAGAAIAILGDSIFGGSPSVQGLGFSSSTAWGFVLAAGSAFVWASYSLLTRRVKAFPTAAIGLFGLISGLLALLCHAVLEPAVALSAQDWTLLAILGLGPLGSAFYLWDYALKRGDARQIGVLSYLTPLGSTALLIVVSGRPWSWSIALAAALIIGAAVVSSRMK